VLEHVKETELLFPPGERWNYSSFGTSLLGVLIERVSGLDYADGMRKWVLAPLGMANASFDVRDLPAERIAAAYHYNPAYDLIPVDEIRPGGSLRAPIAEAARLLSLVLGGGTIQGQTLLKPESMAEMTRLQNGGNPLAKDTPMGLGFRIRARGPLTLLYHDGVSRHRSVFLLAPGQKAGMIVAVNDQQGADTFLWELREAFLAALPAL
jgi:CubicO group peptidase (beta-lactamase class C family)